MLRKWFSWINYGIGGCAALFLMASVILSVTRPGEIALADPALTKRTLPTGAFAMSKEACDAIGKTFDLKFSPSKIQLPDLRNQLLYYGQNGRPDAQQERTTLHFAFVGSPNPSSVVAGETLYLVYDNSKTPAHYTFSPNNAPTPLWLEATPNGNEAAVKVRLRNENNEIVTEPAGHASFKLTEKESVRSSGRVWELGKLRVDGSLLARQKARWVGLDKFLERHGGEEFQGLLNKHRIDFTDEEENTYSVYVGLNDSLIWADNKWKEIRPGEESRNYPLLVVKKIEERLMNFELWDVGGKNKVVLNLLKTNENWTAQNIQGEFKFVGARRRSQYIFEIGDERMFLSPKDWLLQTEEGWVKLSTPEEIDNYVTRKLTGVLFVFDGVVKEEDQQVLRGVMFNSNRTEMQEVSIPVYQGRGQQAVAANNKGSTSTAHSQDEDENDDEDFDDDESSHPMNVPRGPISKTFQNEKAKRSAEK